MSLRRIIINLLVVCLSLIGIACGLLCLLCLIAYVLLHGLGAGSAVLALLCLSCLGLAVMLSGRAAKRESKRLGGARLRSLKSWWPSRGGGAAGVGSPNRGSLDRLETSQASAGNGGAEHWTEDLRSYGKLAEPPDDVGAKRRGGR